jgi:hypothetical protein
MARRRRTDPKRPKTTVKGLALLGPFATPVRETSPIIVDQPRAKRGRSPKGSLTLAARVRSSTMPL